MNARLPETSSIPERLASLRAAMAREGIAAYLVPSADPHLSEYLPGRWQGRQWLSGFTGSAGTLIVTADFAGVWTDSRYWEQASAQLAGTGVDLMKMTGGQLTTPHFEWLAQNVASGGTVGVDGAVLGVAAARALSAALSARGVQLRTDVDLFDAIWAQRPALPADAVFEHAAPQAGVARADKLAQVRRAMADKGAQWHFISTLDDLAWLLNLRGADVSYNPVFVAHALIGVDRVSLFIADGKVSPALADVLARDGISVEPYAKAADALAALPAGSTLLIDPRRITYGSLQAVPSSVKVVEAVNPSTFLKSCKTAADAAHVRDTMEQDGAALAEFFAWFESALGRERITELTIDERLTAARARRPGFVSLSFATIAGFNANGAMPHYRATEESHAVIEGNGLLLIDSGGQYLSGTTDITRVVPIGTPSNEQRRDFTVVLKGMIALSRAQFPRGIRSPMLDAIARAPIWQAGADYGHGTGHGVGYFLNVHEGPQVISHYAPAEPWTAMEEGMITSNEPGLYRPGKWGVRIENLVLNVAAEKTEFGDFLKFETLTLCPIDTRCIELSLLRDDERAWLNAYHETVRARLAPHVSGDAKAWLELRTQPI
ncbi:M24 family metallopeptidase [Paraburkholderia sp. CNPSo 3155]|uniref:Xaa-Pro aminopeptidase n=1 Tax=Paraburkholderia atlantica TaxID=2654982 RepID=A0A6I1Q4N8_PARAM|nr:aminopeptidase P family protein [Paraburkholderia atlantica]MBB5428675.1 Xaa-Pro aminopeptidase [Paraburkholderia atlantica]MPW09295.1 M24 family metallopeptidase [Paraburkholderia atlantica]NUY32533.1 aminopeptidase P family protein [Paraburkholderia atlantica]